MMGGLAVEAVPTPVPIEGGALNGSGVVVMLGTAQADKTLEELGSPARRDPRDGNRSSGRRHGDHRRSRHDDRLTAPGCRSGARRELGEQAPARPPRRIASVRHSAIASPNRSLSDSTRISRARTRRGAPDSTDPTIAAHGIPASAASPATPPTTLPSKLVPSSRPSPVITRSAPSRWS